MTNFNLFIMYKLYVVWNVNKIQLYVLMLIWIGGGFKEISDIVPDSKESDSRKIVSSVAGTLRGESSVLRT